MPVQTAFLSGLSVPSPNQVKILPLLFHVAASILSKQGWVRVAYTFYKFLESWAFSLSRMLDEILRMIFLNPSESAIFPEHPPTLSVAFPSISKLNQFSL